jgi:diacylglycerol kinase family enzyme
MFLAVGNLIAYGGGMKIVPYAKPNDGVLDVCLVKACSAFRLLTTFPRVYFGRHLLAGLTEYWQTDYLEIETEQEAEVRADGEFVQMTPARITVVPKAVHVILPRPFTAG